MIVDWQEVTAIVAALVAILGVAGMLWRGSAELTRTNVRLDANSIAVTALAAENDIIRAEFSKYQIQAAKEFASIEAVYEVRKEIQTGFRDIQTRLDNILLPARKGA